MKKMNNPLIQFPFILLIHHVFTKGRLRLDLIQFLYKQYKHNDNLNLVFNCMMNEVNKPVDSKWLIWNEASNRWKDFDPVKRLKEIMIVNQN